MEYLFRCLTIPCRCYREYREKKKQKCIVKTYHPEMRIRGKKEERSSYFRSKISYIAFRNVPYALPPVGRRRFEPPQPRPKVPFYRRTPLIIADKEEARFCYQSHQGVWEGDEDCLYLNIFLPRKPKDIEGNLPVLVYIHGGGFHSGSKDAVEPVHLFSRELVLVTVNYRLGVLGFLNMRSPNCRGNAGMKDQVMALRWVKKNIAQFKGDPNNVTISGQSAGGSSVNFHMISPLSKGLFHKAIVMAGGVYCPWGHGGHGREMKQLFKKKMNMENELRHVVVETFKSLKVKDLMKLSSAVSHEKFQMESKRFIVFLSPTVECIADEGAFLPDTVESLMEKAEPVPTIAGITKQEGYMFFRDDEMKTTAVEMVTKTTEFLKFLKHNFRWDNKSAWENGEKLRSKYFPNIEKMNRADIKEHLATMVTDLYFRRFYDNFKIGNLTTSDEGPPFYVYEYNYFSGEPFMKHEMSINGYKLRIIIHRAAEHGDDMITLYCPYYLDHFMDRIFLSPKFEKVQEQIKRVIGNMSDLWYSFCETGVPIRKRRNGVEEFEWKPHTEKDPCYLHIDEELLMREGRLKNTRWSELNAICESAFEVPSLASTPQTPEQVIEPAEESMVEWFKNKFFIP